MIRAGKSFSRTGPPVDGCITGTACVITASSAVKSPCLKEKGLASGDPGGTVASPLRRELLRMV
jgi:hypothetical protein